MSNSLISLPELLQARLNTTFCHSRCGIIDGRQLLTQALALSRVLPDKTYAINLCQNRYRFIVAYLAAVIRGQITLLPINQSPNTLLTLSAEYTNSYCLSDNALFEKSDRTDFPTSYLTFFRIPEILTSAAIDEFPLIDPERIISISFTSGSTGEPKAIAKNWREFQQGAHLALQRFKLTRIEAVLLSTVPTQHMYGLETSLFWPLFSNLTVHEDRPFYPQDIAKDLTALAGAGILVSTPVHLKACLNSTLFWPSPKLILSATAPLLPEAAKALENRFKAPLYELFGSTETLSFASRRPAKTSRWQCYDGIYLTQETDGVAVGGGHLPAPVTIDDCFLLHKSTSFSMLGRAEDVLKIAGKRTSLAELNSILTSIEGIDDGVFINDKNERLAAVVVTRLSKKAIRAQLKLSIDPVFLPRRIIYVSDLPRNSTGKLIKSELQELTQRTCLV